MGVVLGLLSWLLLAYGSTALLLSPVSKWGGVRFGMILAVEVVAVASIVASRRQMPWNRAAVDIGIAGWTCAALNYLFLNAFSGTL